MVVKESLVLSASASRKNGLVRLADFVLTAIAGKPAKKAGARGRSAAVDPREAEEERRVAFTLAVVALSARLAVVDGPVSEPEFQAFRALFPISDRQEDKIRRLFMTACRSQTPLEAQARRIAALFPGRKALLAELLDRLFRIAVADSALKVREEALLRKLSGILGFSLPEYRRILRRHIVASAQNPYAILNVNPHISDEGLKRQYRRLMREHHPDRLRAGDQPAHLLEQAHRKVAAMNEAYDRIMRQRGLKGGK